MRRLILHPTTTINKTHPSILLFIVSETFVFSLCNRTSDGVGRAHHDVIHFRGKIRTNGLVVFCAVSSDVQTFPENWSSAQGLGRTPRKETLFSKLLYSNRSPVGPWWRSAGSLSSPILSYARSASRARSQRERISVLRNKSVDKEELPNMKPVR